MQPQTTTTVKLQAHAPAPKVAAVKGPVAQATDGVAEGAPSDAEIRRELQQAFGTSQVVNRASLSPDGLAGVPSSAPHAVEAIIRAANAVALLPYVYGGGHARWEDSAYDCSASVSFALAAAGFLKGPLDSTSFMSWGRAGPGKWVTIFANHGPRLDDRRGPAVRHQRPAGGRIALDGADAVDVRIRAQAPAGPVSTRTFRGRRGCDTPPGWVSRVVCEKRRR